MATDVRWKQRFQNFDHALILLREGLDQNIEKMSALENEGMVHRFGYVLELAWKTLKDYLEFSGTLIIPATPRQVIKEAFAAGILPDGQVWIEMLDHRNLLSHTYRQEVFAEAVVAIGTRYHQAFEAVHEWLLQER